LEQKDLATKSDTAKSTPTMARFASKGSTHSPSDSILQPKNASPSVIPFKSLSKEELSYIGRKFEKKVWTAGTLLFSQGDDRKYFYMLEAGNIEKFKMVFGKKIKLIDLGRYRIFLFSNYIGKYDTIGEEIFLDKTTHSSSASCLTEVVAWVLSNESWELMAEENPKLAIKLMKNAANVMRYRLLYPAKAYMAVEDFARRADVRHEKDSIGEFELPSQAYYGVQTARAIENFPITGIKLCQFPRFIEALCYIKKAAAITNHRLGAISEEKRDAIGAACDEIVGGKLHGHFVVDMVQGGAGTSTNMNANEVIANRGLELMGKQKGQYEYLHPNNDVNHAQSTNDVYPSAIHIATLLSSPQLDESLSDLASALSAKAKEFADILKMGRTQLQVTKVTELILIN
jgi:aspartate ammonia-lyase